MQSYVRIQKSDFAGAAFAAIISLFLIRLRVDAAELHIIKEGQLVLVLRGRRVGLLVWCTSC